MSNAKVVDMTAATSANAADLLYLIQDDTDKKISLTTLLGNLPNVITQLGGVLVLGGAPQALAGGGLILTTQTITLLSNTGSSNPLVINDGSYVGQLKVIIFTDGSLTENLVVGNGSLAFSAGKTALLIWVNSKWWFIGGSAPLT